MKHQNILMLAMLAGLSLPATAQYDIIDSVEFKAQTVDVGANRTFTREQSSASVSIITNKDVNRRGARNIGNNIIGQGNGLVALQGSGLYNVANPIFYIRGLQSLSGSTPLVLVDGVERSIDNVIAEDVESVTILKDAASTALYGYKGANGAILVTTKHGKYESKSIKFSYDHEFGFLVNKPKFADAFTYASAVNEALRNEGSQPRYSDAVLQSYRDGSNPLYYPNVNWVDETFRKMSNMDKFNLEFKGGSRNFRYYTNVNLLTNKGYVNNANMNDGYSTQDKYTRATLRSNMDIDLGPKTKLHTHLFGLLTEQSQPGNQANLWNMVYTVPSNAFPIKATDNIWGGDGTYTTSNPVAQSAGAAYYKNHQRALYADFQLEQDLSAIMKGLSAQAQMGYDTHSNIYEDHSRTYRYGYYTVDNYTGGVVNPDDATLTVDGEDSNMGTGANNNSWMRRFVLNAALNYDCTFGKHALYSQFKWDYEYSDQTGVNTTVYRQNYSLWTHYAYDNRYTSDLALVYSGSSRLAPGTKWGFSPTLSASWNIHNEGFMKDISWVNFLKLRASAGMIQTDNLPGDNVWTYYQQFYTMSGVRYMFYSTYDSAFGDTYIAQAATVNPGREKALKYNIGIDATLFGGFNLSFDYYIQNRKDIWVSTDGNYTAIFGLTAPYENLGRVDSHGLEIAVDYSKTVGNFAFNIGATFNLNKNKIKQQCEEPKLYDNLVSTGLPYTQLFGYKAAGFFQKSDDLNGDGIISSDEFASLGYPEHTFTTIRPGDVRYEDVNGDGKIDSNDQLAIGYSATAPEIYYTFHFGAEWKGLGIDATFQGVGRYSGVMNTNGMYRSAVSTNTLSQYLYDNSWSSERGNTENPLFPRLSSTSNANNDLTSTLNLFDRSYLKLRNVELYYNLPQSLLQKTGFIGKAKIYVRGVDLFTYDNLSEGSAETYGATMPLTRSVQIGASVTF